MKSYFNGGGYNGPVYTYPQTPGTPQYAPKAYDPYQNLPPSVRPPSPYGPAGPASPYPPTGPTYYGGGGTQGGTRGR